MKILISIVFFLLVVQHSKAETLYDQLCTFNFNWKKYESRVSNSKAIVFTNETEYIQEHLKNVLNILKSNPEEGFNAEQITSRHQLINALSQYRAAGRFPKNYYRNERIPVFIDEHNTHCAVGYLMRHTGYESLAVSISRKDNYVWVKDISDPNVIAWQDQSGFTLEELKLIQGAYFNYREDAFTAPNKYEIPQKPEVRTEFFEETLAENENDERNIWFIGEGNKGVLHGKWIQNFAYGTPWIEGYFLNGKRSGQWKEYYQGTSNLCRTENWQNDKLNGIRRRYDPVKGEIIEEILFKNGIAVSKTNIDKHRGIKFIRKPLDSNTVQTEIYTLEGALLASGNERVHNPGNLLWFQNIELTVLNSVAITARDLANNQNEKFSFQSGGRLYDTPPLVEYKKEGDWLVYRNSDQSVKQKFSSSSLATKMKTDFSVLGQELLLSIEALGDIPLENSYDSLVLNYVDNNIIDFFGYGATDFTHLSMRYYKMPTYNEDLIMLTQYNPHGQFQPPHSRRSPISLNTHPLVKSIGQYNESGLRIGTWKEFDRQKRLLKAVTYKIPRYEPKETANLE